LPLAEILRHLQLGAPPSSHSSSNDVVASSTGHTNIHAIIISGLSDPAKVIASLNVTLTGGLVALGKANAASGAVSTWTPGLRIIPDYGLLAGTKIPPVTPNIIDVRIVRERVQADFPSLSKKC
jgi:hypothetical protein